MVLRKQRWRRLQARNLQNYFEKLFLRLFNPLTLFTVLNIFLKLMLISCLTYEILYS